MTTQIQLLNMYLQGQHPNFYRQKYDQLFFIHAIETLDINCQDLYKVVDSKDFFTFGLNKVRAHKRGSFDLLLSMLNIQGHILRELK